MLATLGVFLAKIFLPALVPSVAAGASALIAKVTGEAPVPRTVDDLIKLQQADTARLQAIALMNRPMGQVSQWVANLQVYAHYFACIGVLLYGCTIELLSIFMTVPPDVVVMGGECIDVGIFVLVGLHITKSRQGST